MISNVLFTSNSDEWATPDEIFKMLDDEFSFNLDPCASEENHKCDKYFTADDDGLSKDWGGVECSAIRHTAPLISGLKRHTGRVKQIIRLSFCLFPQEQIQDIFTTLFIKEQKFVLLKVG